MRQYLTPKSLILLNLKTSYQMTKKFLENCGSLTRICENKFCKIRFTKTIFAFFFNGPYFVYITRQAPRTLHELARHPKNWFPNNALIAEINSTKQNMGKSKSFFGRTHIFSCILCWISFLYMQLFYQLISKLWIMNSLLSNNYINKVFTKKFWKSIL